ncbi:MAG: hypothetical protein HZB46_17345, partial [Solirubrobacterales bacterium]|nr:hypothetical protein [Solirubrobacterales bacterium]
AAAAVLAAALVAAAFALGAPAGTPWWWFAAGALALVALLPRAGWVAAAAAVVVLLWLQDAGWGPLVLAAVAPVPLLLREASPPSWSAPALAPVYGLGGLALAFPAVAGQLRRPLHRAALGALGAWWALLAEPLLGERLLYGGTDDRGWDAVAAVAQAPGLALAGVWAAGALLLPYLVRGRVLAVDVVGATAWSAALAAGAQAVTGAPPRGMVAGAVLCGALAVAAAASRGAADAR